MNVTKKIYLLFTELNRKKFFRNEIFNIIDCEM